jgi:hypothetical protein
VLLSVVEQHCLVDIATTLEGCTSKQGRRTSKQLNLYPVQLLPGLFGSSPEIFGIESFLIQKKIGKV